jgi:hypothetical protein
MIDARAITEGPLIQQLEARAERLAAAHAEARLRKRRTDPARWRLPRLLWPLIG